MCIRIGRMCRLKFPVLDKIKVGKTKEKSGKRWM